MKDLGSLHEDSPPPLTTVPHAYRVSSLDSSSALFHCCIPIEWYTYPQYSVDFCHRKQTTGHENIFTTPLSNTTSAPRTSSILKRKQAACHACLLTGIAAMDRASSPSVAMVHLNQGMRMMFSLPRRSNTR
ncbi:unnamed protein product [Lactuca saligna]|uniref:Uncharacterized protein n=1 Tax=Lactuca saligna TaxID=75948 RepID=A0AA35VPL3_LACSI|nr:unnamed protein product [Lactuca saligna]